MERVEEAAEWYERAIEADRKIKGPRFRLAQICLQSGQKEKAIRYLNLKSPRIWTTRMCCFRWLDECSWASWIRPAAVAGAG